MWREPRSGLEVVTVVSALVCLAGLVIGLVVAAQRRRWGRLAGSVALAVLAWVVTVLLAVLTYDDSAHRIGELVVPLAWGGALGVGVSGVTLLGMMLTARPHP